VAIISFETAAEATRAKKQFSGILAKGQPMSIAYDSGPPRAARRIASAPSSLLNRIQKPALADRLTQDDLSTTPNAPRSPGPIRTRHGVRPSRAPKKPKTAEDLDKELDQFMGDGSKEMNGAAPVAALPAATEPQTDVEMA